MGVVTQVFAPDFQASDKGTTWSISTSEACVHVAPSYGENQLPVLEQSLSTSMSVPSRISTVSRVLQEPEMVIQWGNKVLDKNISLTRRSKAAVVENQPLITRCVGGSGGQAGKHGFRTGAGGNVGGCAFLNSCTRDKGNEADDENGY